MRRFLEGPVVADSGRIKKGLKISPLPLEYLCLFVFVVQLELAG